MVMEMVVVILKAREWLQGSRKKKKFKGLISKIHSKKLFVEEKGCKKTTLIMEIRRKLSLLVINNIEFVLKLYSYLLFWLFLKDSMRKKGKFRVLQKKMQRILLINQVGIAVQTASFSLIQRTSQISTTMPNKDSLKITPTQRKETPQDYQKIIIIGKLVIFLLVNWNLI